MKHNVAFLALVESVMPRVHEITLDTLMEWRDEGQALHLIDVREDHEWQKGNIPGAEHIGRGILERDIEGKIPAKDACIVLYCGGGYRSALGADALQQMGYNNVHSLAGGWRAWCERQT